MATTDPNLMPHLARFWQGVYSQNGPARGRAHAGAPINSATETPKFTIKVPQISLASLGLRRK